MVQKQNNFKTFFLVWLVQFLKKKKRDKSKFSWLAQLFKHFFIKIQPNTREQEKKWQTIYNLYLLYGLYQTQALIPLITPYGAF